MDLLRPILRTFNKVSHYFHYPVIGPVLKRLVDLEPEAHTQGYTLTLNADLTDSTQGVVLPIDMMKQAVRQSEYRAIMKKCLCRSAYSCKNFPQDHGCIFIGDGARGLVEGGSAREATVDEALAHIDRAAELGLIGQALWIEVERFLLGVKREKDVAHWLEMCFCCPCCCGTFKLTRATNSKDIKGRFRSIGWKAVINDELCTQCQECTEQCPINAIYLENDSIVINQQECLGCGFCAAHCPEEAIKLQLQAPLLGTVKDYFTNSGLNVDV